MQFPVASALFLSLAQTPWEQGLTFLWSVLAGQSGLLGAKAVMAGPEKKVGLERENLLKQFSEDVMRWPGCNMF